MTIDLHGKRVDKQSIVGEHGAFGFLKHLFRHQKESARGLRRCILVQTSSTAYTMKC